MGAYGAETGDIMTALAQAGAGVAIAWHAALADAPGAGVRLLKADGGGLAGAVSWVGEAIGVDGATAAVLVFGLAILCMVPLLALAGYSAGRVMNRSRELADGEVRGERVGGEQVRGVAGDVGDDAHALAPSGAGGLQVEPGMAADGASTTMLVPGNRAKHGGSGDPKRVTTQALRMPPRAGAARLVVDRDDGDTEDETAADAAKAASYPLGKGSLIRIGRDADNEVVLAAPTVHRYHAVIRRTADAGYIVFDMSGPGGNGVYVNGERVKDAQLGNGDRIALGTARLRFLVGV